ncbi:ABC transporter ATP-binding protein [Rhodococcus sp. NPDC003348]
MPGSSFAVAIDNLVVRRGDVEVLHGLDLRIPTGSITGLLGPSGCGKTTLMRAIVGTQIVESGTVTVLGESAGSPQLRHRVGYVTQSPTVYPDLSVRQNIAYFAALYGRPARAATDVMAMVDLAAQADVPAGELSGGQLGRVSLGCALVGEPELLILDEPTVGLDPVLRADLWERFAGLAASGTTLLISSHVMEEAEHCHDLLLLRDGHLLAQLSPGALLEQTRETNLEHAFLTLIREREVQEQS